MLVLAWGGEARSQPIPLTCQEDLYDVHSARAWMGGKRDMESAQSLINITPVDSILYMSCYEKHIAEFAEKDDVLFSDGHLRTVGTGARHGRLFRFPPLCFGPACIPVPWLTGALLPSPGNPLIIVPQMPIDLFQPTIISLPGPNPPGLPFTNFNLDGSFINLIRIALRPYWTNFELSPLPGPPAVICGNMSEIWYFAKCTDINKDNFLTLEDHKCIDRRGCEGCGRGKWTAAFDVANPPPVINPFINKEAGVDITWITWTITPPSCAEGPPVPTGVIVNVGGSAHQDAACPGVNCWYDYASGSCNE